MPRPIIGITPSMNDMLDTYKLYSNYAELTYAAGGEPVILSYGFTSVHILDGVILSGGGDLDATRTEYDHPELAKEVNPQRDACELALFSAANALALPMLGICRGHQVLNAGTGGSLICDIHAAGFSEEHSLGAEGGYHPITCVKGSLAERIFTQHGEVWSTHHQAVDRPGAGFSVTARSPEGVVEAIEHENGRLLGLQTHPERMGLSAPFEWLVQRAKGKRV